MNLAREVSRRPADHGAWGHRLPRVALLFILSVVALAAAPTVTGVTNNYSFIPAGYANSGVTPSSLVTIFGSGMANAPTGPVVLESSGGSGIPKSLNGASISVTVNGTTVTPAMYYAIPTQIAAVLPAATPTGSGTLTVTYQGSASNAFPIQVVASAFGLDTYHGTGSGLITATDAKTGALFNYTHSASPGQKITLWGTGLGADPQDSDTVFSTTPHAINQSSVQVYFGGVAGKVTYAGSSGYPGVDQINVIVPDPVGCNVSVTTVIAGTASNFPTAPLAQDGGECSDPLFGVTGSALSATSTGPVNSAGLFVAETASTDAAGIQTMVSAALADFQHYSSLSGGGLPSIGSCIVSEALGSPTSTGVDVGTVTLMGPGGNYTLMGLETGVYGGQIPTGGTPPGGTFVFNWTGGAKVGGSTVTITLPDPFLTWTNRSASTTVTRADGIQVKWSGGSPGSFVIITGVSSPSGGPSVSFTCYADQGALSFTVPGYVTSLLPAGKGTLGLVDTTPYKRITASGLNSGAAWGSSGDGLKTVTYQ